LIRLRGGFGLKLHLGCGGFIAQAIQEAYNDFKRDINEKSWQVTLFYYKFRQYVIKPGQPDHTPPCRRRKEEQEIRAKLL
jgi:hypothetical protein